MVWVVGDSMVVLVYGYVVILCSSRVCAEWRRRNGDNGGRDLRGLSMLGGGLAANLWAG
jgi:hypothetical protein